MSSLKFESLKDDFESISSRLDHQPISAQALTRLNSILSNLEDEARGAPERYRAGMIEDVEDYRKQLRGYQAEAAGMGIRTSGQEELTRMQQSIQRSTATALESERIGTEVIEDLNYQRERLSGARDRLQEANTEINKTRTLIRGIWMNVVGNKWILGGIIFMEIIIILALIYIKFIK